MAGVTVNGIGWGDSFYPIKSLGMHYCKDCKTEHEFSLMEVRRKIKVLYVPLLTFNTKYAVACNTCKNGFYVNDEQRDALLYRNATLEIKDDAATIHYQED